MKLIASLVLLAALTSPALADNGEPVDRVDKTTLVKVPVAIATNLPISWALADSYAGSLYVGLTKHVAIRANIASYEFSANPVGEILSVADGGDGDEASRSGGFFDLGAGVVHYSNKLWDGWTLEAGVLRRSRDITITDEFSSRPHVETTSVTWAGRALVGYSWLIGDHVFLSAAVGVSAGIERGDETTADELGRMEMTRSVDRADVAAESYLRLGGAFDF